MNQAMIVTEASLGCSGLHHPEQFKHVLQDQYELLEDSSGAIAHGAPRHWRQRAEQLGCGAFHGLRVRLALWHSMQWPSSQA